MLIRPGSNVLKINFLARQKYVQRSLYSEGSPLKEITMNYKNSCLAAAGALVLSIACSPGLYAATNGCKFSSNKMHISCEAERKEEFNATIARCASISDSAERGNCYGEAEEERKAAKDDCSEQRQARLDVCVLLAEDRYEDPMAAFPQGFFIDPDDIGTSQENNPYVKLQSGHTHVLRAEEEDEDSGETSVELIVVHATDEIREIQGVLCRVVVDVVLEPEWDVEEGNTEYQPIEVTDDWFGQDVDRNVYYCGEVARNFEDGVLRDLDGSFEAGLELAEGGVLTLAMPMPADVHRQEYALGEAEDIVEYLSLGATPQDLGVEQQSPFSCGDEGEGSCLMTHDSTPLEPGAGEYKYYKAGVGFIEAIAFEDGEPAESSSEWLVCTGDSLAILEPGTDCGFSAEESAELLDALCDLHDEFCDDGED
jgi:hypothetical protein